MNPGIGEFALRAFVIVVVFGHRRLPALGRHLGRGIVEFTDGITGKGDREEVPVARDDAPLAP
jgi:Sec-independent protein translocase protein TatA